MKFKPHSLKQQNAIFSDAPITVLATGIQWGKAVSFDTKVLTPNGIKRASEIREGDELIDRLGDPTKVIGVFPQGKRDSYRIATTDKSFIEVDLEHLNIVIDPKNRGEKVLTTKELLERPHYYTKGKNRASIPSVRPINYSEKKLEIDPYVLGALIGDGYLSKKGASISSADKEVLERIEEAIKRHSLKLRHTSRYDYGIISTNRPKRDEFGRFIKGGNFLLSKLREFGLAGRKSHEKFIPHEYLFSSIDQRLGLLRGLMDSDGTVTNDKETKSNRKMTYYTTSVRLRDDFIFLVESLGGKCWYRVKKTSKRDCFVLNVILKEFNPFFIKRKASKYFVHKHTENKFIESIEYVGRKDAVCFKVDSPTSSFVCNGHVVTHNTQSGCLRMKRLTHIYNSPRDNFLVVAPTYKILKQSTLPAFMSVFRHTERYNKAENEYSIPGGGTVYFRTATDPDSIVGMTNVRGIHGDEAGKFSRYFWDNLEARAAFRNCQVIITTSPYSMNWLYKDLIKPHEKGLRDDICYITAASVENPYFPKEVYYKRKETMDHRRFMAIYGGVFTKMQGLVYDCLDDDENYYERAEFPAGTLFFGGIDWGFSDPFVLQVRAVTPNGYHYQVSEFYKTGMKLSDIKKICEKKQRVYNMKSIYADPSQPGYIAELNAAGLPVVPADNDILKGIDLHYELIKSRRFKILKGSSPLSTSEYESYHWPEPSDLKPDQDAKKEKPVDQDNHSCDTARYITVMTHRRHKQRQPSVNTSRERRNKFDGNTQEYINRLRKGRSNHSETWS